MMINMVELLSVIQLCDDANAVCGTVFLLSVSAIEHLCKIELVPPCARIAVDIEGEPIGFLLSESAKEVGPISSSSAATSLSCATVKLRSFTTISVGLATLYMKWVCLPWTCTQAHHHHIPATYVVIHTTVFVKVAFIAT